MKKLLTGVIALCCAGALAFAGGKADGDVIKIGAIFPLSGGVAEYGIASRDGAVLAIEEINAAGGIGGKKLQLIAEDDDNNPEKTVNAFKKLVTQNKVIAIIGSSTSGATMSITALAQQQKIPVITPSGTAYAVTDAGDFIFRTTFIDPFQGVVGAKFAVTELKAKTAALLYDKGNDYCTGLAAAFVENFKKLGGTIVAEETYMTNDVDFNAQITKVKATRPDVIYLPDYYNTVILLAKQLRSQDVTVPIFGGDGWSGVADNGGDEVLNSFYSTLFAADATDPKSKAFVAAYRAKFGKVPSTFGALGYDSAVMLKDAIVRAGSTDTTAVKDAIAKTNGDYVTGRMTFDAHRDPVKAAVFLEIVRDGAKLKEVYKTTVNP
jgi:branched-chain amino acid transport system substrate-binding protein